MSLTSIIILNWNGLELTKQCIESLHKNTSPPFEVIVVDNGSKEPEKNALRQLLKKGRINKLIENSYNKGFAGANNQGMRKAKGEYLLLLNNDTVATKNWLKELVKVAEESEKNGIVGPRLPESRESKTVYGGGYVDISGIAKHSFNKQQSEAEQVGGAAIFIKRSVFERIGELDEGFSPIYFEETDYCARARKAGFKVVFTPKSMVIHFGSKITTKQTTKWQYVTMAKNRIRFMLLHFPVWKLVVALPFEAARFAKSLPKLTTPWLLEAYCINLKNIGEIVGKRIRYKQGKLKVING